MVTDLTSLSTSGQVTVAKGDNLVNLDFTVTDADDAVVNLTGATVKFKMSLPEATTLKVNGACQIINAAAGTCRYQLTSADLDTTGAYLAELEVTFSTGRIITIRDLIINVVGDLPRGTSG